jgi:hypothetical protein
LSRLNFRNCVVNFHNMGLCITKSHSSTALKVPANSLPLSGLLSEAFSGTPACSVDLPHYVKYVRRSRGSLPRAGILCARDRDAQTVLANSHPNSAPDSDFHLSSNTSSLGSSGRSALEDKVFQWRQNWPLSHLLVGMSCDKTIAAKQMPDESPVRMRPNCRRSLLCCRRG